MSLPVATVRPRSGSVRPPGADPHASHRARVLAVDDEEAMLHIIRAGLTRMGHDVATFNDAEKAIEEFRSNPRDVVISDIMMPKVDGFGLLKAVRERDPDVPVVLVTAYSSLDYALTAMKEGAYGFITKPFRIDELGQTVERALERRLLLQENVAYRVELERKVAERTAQLEREFARREKYIAAAQFGFVALHPDGRVQTLNARAATLLGLTGGDPMGRPLAPLLPDGIDVQVLALLDRVRRECLGEERRSSVHAVHRVDRRQVLELTAYPVKVGEELTDVVLLCEDVSEKTLMERQLRQSASLASLGELAAGVAHEINNPVGYIGSNLTTLARYGERLREYVGAADEVIAGVDARVAEPVRVRRAELQVQHVLADMPQVVADCQDGIESIKKIVQGLRVFARPDDERPEEADLHEAVLERAIALAHNEVKQKAEIVRQYQVVPRVRCFPNALCQVFINLLVNAAQAIAERGEIVVRTSSAPGGGVVVEVSDNGRGIPEENLDAIFDPFFTTKDVGVGTGLGLSISYGIVRRHGGSIDVYSRLGEGSTFVVQLPAAPPE